MLTGRQVFNLFGRAKDWYKITNRADRTEIWLYDGIGYDGITAADFNTELQNINTDRIDVHVSSSGGDVFDGIAIYNALRTHPAEVHVQVDSMAASIASVIAQAGNTRTMLSGSQMMIHEAHGLAVGNSRDMVQLAGILDKQSDIIAGIYAERSGQSAAGFRELMTAETWFDAEETVKAGLADKVVKPATTNPTPRTTDWADVFSSMKLTAEEILCQ